MATDTDALHFSRRYAIAPDRLWPLMTDAGLRTRWSAPSDDMELVVVKAEPWVGGIDRHRCGPADAPDFEVETLWYNLDAPNLAVFTETLEFAGERPGTALVTYALTATGTGPDMGTELGITVATSSFSGPEMLAEFKGGWDSALANLDREVAAETARPPS